MPDITISCTDPGALRVDTPTGTLIALGVSRSALSRIERDGADPDKVESFIEANRNAAAILISTEDGAVRSVDAWRGIFSEIDIFYATLADGSLVVSDHFRNVVCELPVSARGTSDAALIEHYLCGWVYDTATYSAGVLRVGMGNRLAYDPSTAAVTITQFDRIHPITESDGLEGLVQRVEAALEAVMMPLVSDPTVCATFSGGVDSTLLASFLGDDTELVAMTTDTAEFAIETEYAETAAHLLGRNLTEMRVFERDFRPLLDDLIERTAIAPAHYVMPMLACLYDRSEAAFILGEGADSVFGTDRGLRRIAGAFANRVGLGALGIGKRLPGPVGYRSGQILSYATEYAESPLSTDGAAARSLLFGDPSQVISIVGPAAVEAVLQSHLDAVLERVELEVPHSDRFNSHMELIRWRNTMADLATIDRMTAQVVGKRVIQPYIQAEVIDELRRAPAEKRYVKGLAGKWVLKEMLANRVPEYPVNQRKNATGLPFERYYANGPLSDIWDDYPVPDFIPESMKSEVLGTPSPVVWNAITHAIWSSKVEKNPELKPLPSVAGYTGTT